EAQHPGPAGGGARRVTACTHVVLGGEAAVRQVVLRLQEDLEWTGPVVAVGGLRLRVAPPCPDRVTGRRIPQAYRRLKFGELVEVGRPGTAARVLRIEPVAAGA